MFNHYNKIVEIIIDYTHCREDRLVEGKESQEGADIRRVRSAPPKSPVPKKEDTAKDAVPVANNLINNKYVNVPSQIYVHACIHNV